MQTQLKALAAALQCLLVVVASAAAVQPGQAIQAGEVIAQALQAGVAGPVVTVDFKANIYELAPSAQLIVIPANTTLLLTGSGASTYWDASAPIFSLQAGAKLVIQKLLIIVGNATAPTALPAGLTSAWPVPFISASVSASAPPAESGSIQLADLTMQLSSCSNLAAYQGLVCGLAAADPYGEQLWGLPQLRPGSVYFRAALTDSRFRTMSNVLLTCGATASAPGPSVQPSSSLSFALAGFPTPSCLIEPVANATQLLNVLSVVSNSSTLPPSPLLLIQVQNDIQLDSSVWPLRGVTIAAAVTLAGMPNSMQGSKFSGFELDLDGVKRFVMVDQDLGSLAVADLCLTNMAMGSDRNFPSSLLVGAAWVIHFDRPSANRTMLMFRDSQLVVPPDLFGYLSYWGAIQSSVVPSVRVTANWLLNNVYFGLTVGGADEHYLLFSRREGQGTLWINSTLTDKPYHTKLLLEKTGITDLVPGSPNTPLTQVQPVFNASHLVQMLQAPPVPYLVLLYSMRLDMDTVQAVVGNTSAPANISQAVTLIGRPNNGSVVLDLGGAARLFSVSVPQGSRLVFARMLLTGLGQGVDTGLQASGNTEQPMLNNLTSLLWAADFSRKQPMLRLTNVALVVSPAELYVMQQALSPQKAVSNGMAAADKAVLAIIQTNWALSNVADANATALLFSDVGTFGIDGSQVTLSSILPDITYSTSSAFTFEVTPVTPFVLTAPPSPPSPDSGGQGLPTWALAVIITGVGLVSICAGLLGWFWLRRVRYLKREVDEERAAKNSALEQVEALVSARQTPSEGSQMFSNSEHNQRTLAGLGRAAAAVSVLPPRTNSSQDSLNSPHRASQLSSLRSNNNLAPGSRDMQSLNSSMLRTNGAIGSLEYGSSSRAPRSTGLATSSRRENGEPAGGGSSSSGKRNSVSSSNNSGTLSTLVPITGVEAGSQSSASTVPSRPRPSTRSGGGRSEKSKASSKPASARTVSSHMDLVRGSHDVGDFATTLRQSIVEPLGPSMAALLLNPEAAPVVLGVEAPLSSVKEAGNGKVSTSSSNGSATKPTALLMGGLAAGDEEQAPADVLQQIINQRKAMQGIDLQQVEFQEVLGQGSFGVVYKGKWRSLTVAIKTLMFQDAGAAKRIRQRAITEAAINTLLTDDNIINTYAYDLRVVAGGGMPDEKHMAHWKLYIIQEYCDAGSLAQAIDSNLLVDPGTGRNNMMLILQIALDIAQGMSYIHAANVIHGDLSSGNIMLRYEQRQTSCFHAKVGDFGLSRFLEGPEHSHISNARQGTPFYISPELLNDGIISKETDVFSFGVLLWEMFCGMPPWRDPDMARYRHTLNPRTFPYHVPLSCPSEYHALIMACLAEQPKSRPKFTELVKHISSLLQLLQDALAQRGMQKQQQMQQYQQRQSDGMMWQESVPEHPEEESMAMPLPAPAPPRPVQTESNAVLQLTERRIRGAAAVAAATAAAAAAAAAVAPAAADLITPATSAPNAMVDGAAILRGPSPTCEAHEAPHFPLGASFNGTTVAAQCLSPSPVLGQDETMGTHYSDEVVSSHMPGDGPDDGIGSASSISAPLLPRSLGTQESGSLGGARTSASLRGASPGTSLRTEHDYLSGPSGWRATATTSPAMAADVDSGGTADGSTPLLGHGRREGSNGSRSVMDAPPSGTWLQQLQMQHGTNGAAAEADAQVWQDNSFMVLGTSAEPPTLISLPNSGVLAGMNDAPSAQRSQAGRSNTAFDRLNWLETAPASLPSQGQQDVVPQARNEQSGSRGGSGYQTMADKLNGSKSYVSE